MANPLDQALEATALAAATDALEASVLARTAVLEGKAGGKLFGMGNATYDVEKMHAAAEGKPTVDVDARQFAHAFGEVRIEPTYAMKTNLSKPVLLAAAPNGGVRLVDGWHRAYKAAHVGKALKGRVIGEHELESCRVTEAAGVSDVPAVIEPGDNVEFYNDDPSEPWGGRVLENTDTGIYVRPDDTQVWGDKTRLVIGTLGDKTPSGRPANHLLARDLEEQALDAARSVLSGGSTTPDPFP